MKRNIKRMARMVVAVVLISILVVLNGSDVLAEGCDYTHSVSCSGGDSVNVREHLYVNSITQVSSSVTFYSGIINESRHTLQVYGEVDDKWPTGDQKYIEITQSKYELSAGTYDYDWSGHQLFIEAVRGVFYVQKGTGSHTVTGLKQYVGY